MKTPILGGYAVARSVNAADNRLMNLYPEATPEGGKTSGFLTRCPGYKYVSDVGTGPIRGLWTFGGFLYVVSGVQLYKVDSAWTPTLVGTVSGSGPVSMSDNGDQLFVACNPRSYTYSALSNTFAEITDPDFPGAVTVGFINGYFVFNEPNSQKVWITSYQDGASIDPLEFAFTDANPDNLLSLVVNRNEIWMFGTTSTEVWYYSGDIDFPLARIQGAFNEIGCAAPYSVAKLDNTVFWLGSDPRGNAMVYKAAGYGAQRVSTHGIEKVLQGYEYVGDAIGYSYQQEGHTFYVLTFPSANATWVFDAATNEWHERGSWKQGRYNRHRSNCQANFNNTIVLGDYQLGKLYEFDLEYYQDDIGTQRWVRSWRALPPNANNLNRTAHHSLQVEMETGTTQIVTTESEIQYALIQNIVPLGVATPMRLAPIFWTVNFNSEMMAALVTNSSSAMTCTCTFRTAGDLAGIEFISEDNINGAAYSYETEKNYLGLTFNFTYQISGNAVPLDDVNGAVLTVEGRDSGGTPTTWYIRLWNYATGTGTNANISLNFSTMQAGFFADQPFYGGDIDRMFISVIPIGYTGVTTPITETTATISITNMTTNQNMVVNNSLTPSNDIRMSNGYDNVYNQTPESVVRQILQCGCSTLLDWYVGASHYYSVSWDGSAFVVDPAKQKLNPAAAAWHVDFFNRLLAANITPIIAFSLEILTPNMPPAWAQRTYTGAISATGYTPITTSLISPCNVVGIQHMYDSYNYVLSLMPGGMTKYIQFGEWWWWCNVTVPCYYDGATVGLYAAETGFSAPIITSINNDWEFAAAFVQWCGDQLGKATDTVKTAVLAAYPDTQVSALIFPPQFHNIPGAYQIDGKTVLEVTNLPVEYWKYPNLTWCQVEDYDWVTSNNTKDMQYTVKLAFDILGYPASKIDYFAGFAVNNTMWPSIQNALNMWAKLNVNELFLWSQIQVNRDDIKIYESGDIPAFFALDPNYSNILGVLSVGNSTWSWGFIGSFGCSYSVTSRSSGKYYFEIQNVVGGGFAGTFYDNWGLSGGISTDRDISNDILVGSTAGSWGFSNRNFSGSNSEITTFHNGTPTTYSISQIPEGGFLGVAVDLDAGKVWFCANGVWVDGGDPVTGTNPAYTFTPNQVTYAAVGAGSYGPFSSASVNLGALSFSLGLPTGYEPWRGTTTPVPFATTSTVTIPKVLLRWSDDGGHTWSNYYDREMGALGEYWTRVIWRRLGMTTKLRDRVYELSGSDPVKITITGAELVLSGTNS